uniref:Putative secreted protein n=1 Tax=Xenopsylla cheopis TaxID=163159 RepID=A0A6M2DVE9_XENCH
MDRLQLTILLMHLLRIIMLDIQGKTIHNRLSTHLQAKTINILDSQLDKCHLLVPKVLHPLHKVMAMDISHHHSSHEMSSSEFNYAAT